MKISDFRLIAGNMIKPDYSGKLVFRVNILEDLILEKWSCDSYSTTRDTRTLDELGYEVLIWDAGRGKWEKHNEYKGMKIHEIPNIKRSKLDE